MQFTREDQLRYRHLHGRTSTKGKHSLSDLETITPGHRLLHCPGSGYRLEYSFASDERKQHIGLSGAHRTLHQVLWSKERHGGKKVPGSKSVTRLTDGSTYYGSAGGLARGSKVHLQVADFVSLPLEQYKARHEPVDPMTQAVLSCLHRLGYLGVHAEYLVYHEALGLGTAVDLVCLDRSGTLVFIELKTGYHDAFTVSKKNSTMKGPFASISDTPLNRARTQILLAQALYASNHKIVPTGCVIHVDRKCRAMAFDMGPFQRSTHNHRRLLTHLQQTNLPGKKRKGHKRKRSLSSSSSKHKRSRKSAVR